jgi:hypothetical protein
MEAVAHSPSFAKKAGVPQSVGKDFAATDKGKTFKHGGGMKKYAEGGMSEKDMKENEAYRKKREYYGYEDYTPSGRAAIRHYNDVNSDNPKDYVKQKYSTPYDPVAAKKAQAVQREVMNEGRRETRGTVPAAALKKGGEVKESKTMVGKEVAFMKKKGAPDAMIKHEKSEMMGMKKGGKVRRYGAGGGPLGDESIMTDEEYAKQREQGAKNWKNLKNFFGFGEKEPAPIDRSRNMDRTTPVSAAPAQTTPAETTRVTTPKISTPAAASMSDQMTAREKGGSNYGADYGSDSISDYGDNSGSSSQTFKPSEMKRRKPIGVEKTQTKERVITAPVKPFAKDVSKFISDSPDLESRMEAMKPKRKFGMASDETRAAIRKGLGSAFDFFDLSKAHEREFGKKMAKGGNVDGIAKKGKTEGKVVKMAAGGFVKNADGCAQRGKTKAFQVKMKRGGMC